MKYNYLYIIIIFYFLTNFLTAQDGVLDPTFGAAGFVRTDIVDGGHRGNSVAIQDDGKIIVAGSDNSIKDLVLVRYNLDGSLDTSFDTDGIVVADFGLNSSIVDLAIQSDGKIVVVFHAYRNPDGHVFQLNRYNINGSLDASFGIDGKVSTSFGDIGAGAAEPRSLVIQSDGKIIVAGYGDKIGKYNFILARYNIDGSLDTSFDDDGRVNTDFGEGEKANSIAIQSDGKIIVAGETGFSDFALVRYNTNGSLDASFGSYGRVVTPIGAGKDVANDLAIQPDGKIVVAGYSKNSTDEDFALVRYNSDGSLDVSFDADGIVITDFNPGRSDFAQSMAIQSDGKIVLAGYSNGASSFDQNLALARYNVDGRSVTIQVDGKIVVVGDYNNKEFFVVRYNNPSLLVGIKTSEVIINGFSLQQNYPNPFNPTTTISYSIPVVDANLASTTNTELIIYDVLGKEVAILVNEQKAAGNYKVEFDGSNLSSGVYYYQLRSGDFIETKKMLLMK
jgi:uncharacterized delta-60 repeat protein